MENVVSNLPSHVTVLPLMLDIAHNTAALPGDGTSKITLTYTHNIAAFIPPLLSLPTWEQHYLIQGDVRSWNEILAAAEKGKGVKFQVAYDSVEKMKGGRVTELPGHERVYGEFGGREKGFEIVQGVFATYGLWMEEGLFVGEGIRLNDVFPEVGVMGLEEAWKLAGGK